MKYLILLALLAGCTTPRPKILLAEGEECWRVYKERVCGVLPPNPTRDDFRNHRETKESLKRQKRKKEYMWWLSRRVEGPRRKTYMAGTVPRSVADHCRSIYGSRRIRQYEDCVAAFAKGGWK